VPYTRGREQSLDVETILEEVNKLIVQGYKQINLLGQNVNSYKGLDKNGKEVDFATLLKKIDKIPGDYWISFVASHPKDLSDDLIKCFKTCTHLMPYLHLAVQSGSDKIIKSMNRHYTAKQYLELIKKTRQTKKDIAITTDVIVGYPGETLQDFEDTFSLLKKAKFDLVFISQYSPRSGTASSKLVDDVPKVEKKRRDKALNEILRITALENNKKFVNKKVKVLIERRDIQEKNIFFGKTNQLKNVKVIASSDCDLVGRFADVKINLVSAWKMEGELVQK
jgi:tRNA-2-methylthio-N6-dimethylallyladenosine synthase